MLGRVIYRNADREMTADLFAALTCRYPTKGLELTRDGDLHIIKAAGATDVIEAFIAGMKWQEERWTPAAHLPDADTMVMICAPSEDEPVQFGYWTGDLWRDMRNQRVTVTHWRDLPDVPASVRRELACMSAIHSDDAMDSDAQ